SDAGDLDWIQRALLRVCMQNGDPSWPLVERAPTFIVQTRGLPLVVQLQAHRYLLGHTPDVGALAAALMEHPSDPWARATARFQHERAHVQPMGIDDYIGYAMAPEHVAQELGALPNAWKSAIDYQVELGRAEPVARTLPWRDVAAYLANLLPSS